MDRTRGFDRDPARDEREFERLRRQMVDWQLASRGIRDPSVLAAMGEVPRHRFVPAHLVADAYDDSPLPIGFGQTISQPLTVAWMAQALQLQGDEKVLEVGTGSGYGAAVLSRLAAEVHTIERIPQLAERATKVLDALHYHNVTVHSDDGTLGLAEEAPFDAIIVTAAGETLPPPYAKQLRDGGRILIPLGRQEDGQQMMRFNLQGGGLRSENLGLFAFVPLLGKYGATSAVAPPATDLG
jgi:protein-L-isoaspartate(D-aspartate) O-methyltransferase